MKKLIIIASIFIIGLSSCDCGCDDYKYTITDSRGNYYYTTDYTKDGDCISFKSKNGIPTTLCGSFRIKENINYKKQ